MILSLETILCLATLAPCKYLLKNAYMKPRCGIKLQNQSTLKALQRSQKVNMSSLCECVCVFIGLCDGEWADKDLKDC